MTIPGTVFITLPLYHNFYNNLCINPSILLTGIGWVLLEFKQMGDNMCANG